MNAVKMVFRNFQGETIALMFELTNGKYCDSYAHMGQHSEADFQGVMGDSEPASDSDVAPLKLELERIGYKVIQVK